MRKPLNDHYRSVFSVAMEGPVRVPASVMPTPPAPQAPQFAGATSEALANELKARRKAEREAAKVRAEAEAKRKAYEERTAEFQAATALRHAELQLLSLMRGVEVGDAPAGYSSLVRFEKECAPLAKQFGYKIVRIGTGDRCTVVKVNEATK